MVSLHIFAQAYEHQEALRVARELSLLYKYSVHIDQPDPTPKATIDQAVRALSILIDSPDNEKKISIFDASTILSLIYDRPKEETLYALMQHRRAEGKAV